MFGIRVRCFRACVYILNIYTCIVLYSIEWRRFLRHFRVVRWLLKCCECPELAGSVETLTSLTLLEMEKKSTSDLLHETDFILLTCTPRKTNGWNLKMNPWSPGDSYIFLLESHHSQVPAVSFFLGVLLHAVSVG